MKLLDEIVGFFKSAPKDAPSDRYGILSPLLATGDYVNSTTDLVALFHNSVYSDLLLGKTKAPNKLTERAVAGYNTYLKHLPSHDREREKQQPFSTIDAALQAISTNIVRIEDNFQNLFGTFDENHPEQSLKTSSMIVIGYLEKADGFATWLGNLVEHMTAKEGDMIPPFRTKELVEKAPEAAEFAGSNLNKWNPVHSGFLTEITDMQKKGIDVSIQSSDGTWLNDVVHDDQLGMTDKDLMVAALRSPITMIITKGLVRTQAKIDLLSSRKDWLTSKIVLEQSKLRGMDESSPEYKRIKKATDHYADLVSRYEQKIERMRA